MTAPFPPPSLAAQVAEDPLPVTLQCCEECGTEGRIISIRYRRWQEPEEIDHGECPACEGQCSRLFKTWPVTEEEIMEAP